VNKGQLKRWYPITTLCCATTQKTTAFPAIHLEGRGQCF